MSGIYVIVIACADGMMMMKEGGFFILTTHTV